MISGNTVFISSLSRVIAVDQIINWKDQAFCLHNKYVALFGIQAR